MDRLKKLIIGCCLLSCSLASSQPGVYVEKKILLINNLSTELFLTPPILRNVLVSYPGSIPPFSQAVIRVSVKKDWLVDNPVDVQYTQVALADRHGVEISLIKRTPDPRLLKPFVPGYDCKYKPLEKKYFKIDALEGTDGYCSKIHIYK